MHAVAHIMTCDGLKAMWLRLSLNRDVASNIGNGIVNTSVAKEPLLNSHYFACSCHNYI